MASQIKIEGLEEIIKAFNRMADPTAYAHLEGAVRDGALALKRRAKLLAPVNSGALKKAISSRKRRAKKGDTIIRYDVGPRDKRYSGFVILGHRIKNSGKRTQPNNFMKAAADEVREEFIDLAVKALTLDIGGMGEKK